MKLRGKEMQSEHADTASPDEIQRLTSKSPVAMMRRNLRLWSVHNTYMFAKASNPEYVSNNIAKMCDADRLIWEI